MKKKERIAALYKAAIRGGKWHKEARERIAALEQRIEEVDNKTARSCHEINTHADVLAARNKELIHRETAALWNSIKGVTDSLDRALEKYPLAQARPARHIKIFKVDGRTYGSPDSHREHWQVWASCLHDDQRSEGYELAEVKFRRVWFREYIYLIYHKY